MPDTLQRLTADEVAYIWQVDRKTVYHLLKTGMLRGSKVCGLWRVPPEAIPEYEATIKGSAEISSPSKERAIVTKIV